MHIERLGRLKEALIRTGLALIVGGALNMARPEPIVKADGYPTVEFAVMDYLNGAARIGYNWNFPSYVPHPYMTLTEWDPETGMSYFLHYWPSCDRPVNGYSCYFNIPEARNWSEFTPAINSVVQQSMVDRSVHWKNTSGSTFARNLEIYRNYLPNLN